MKTLNSYNFKDKVVLVRSDINSDVIGQKVLMSERIKETAITIKELKKKGAKVVVVAHQGRKGKKDCLSLRKHSKLLNKYVKIKFIEDLIGEKATKAIALKKTSLKNCLYILGGAKPADNIKLLGKNKTIATGFFGQLCLISKGFKFGEYEKFLKDLLGEEFDTYKKLNGKLKNTILPVDYAVMINNKRHELELEKFPSKYIVYDIGEKTIEMIKAEIRKAKSIYIKGPSGDCREKQFCKGTIEILKEASNAKGFTLIGGGHLNDAIDKSKISRKKFDHISLSGGALLSYLSGEKLPGLEALK
jgi:3-phosphoglycerate kinase